MAILFSMVALLKFHYSCSGFETLWNLRKRKELKMVRTNTDYKYKSDGLSKSWNYNLAFTLSFK